MKAILHSQNKEKNYDEPRVYDDVEIVTVDYSKGKAIVLTKDGIKCSAIYNPWLGWMADDIYGVIE